MVFVNVFYGDLRYSDILDMKAYDIPTFFSKYQNLKTCYIKLKHLIPSSVVNQFGT